MWIYTMSAGICMFSLQQWTLSSKYDINVFPRILSSLSITTDVCGDCWYFQIKIYVMLNKWVDGAREMSFHFLQDIKIVHQPVCHHSSGYTHAYETFKTFELKEHICRQANCYRHTKENLKDKPTCWSRAEMWALLWSIVARFQELSGQVTVS